MELQWNSISELDTTELQEKREILIAPKSSKLPPFLPLLYDLATIENGVRGV